MKTKIEKWLVERNIHTQDSKIQMCKVTEEVGELARAVIRQDIPAIKDSIGDTYVTLMAVAVQNNLDIDDCIEVAYNEIQHREGRLVDGVFVKNGDNK